MSVGFQVDFYYYSVGTGDFLNSFFSTIFVKLESSNWGSRFPMIMNQLYQGCLSNQNISQVQNELELIKEELQLLPPSEIVWDFEDLSQTPLWGDNISPDIQHMADYFVTSSGKNLLSVLQEAFKEAIELNEDVFIISI